MPLLALLVEAPVVAQGNDTSIPKLVFAHYMVCCPPNGGKASVEDFMGEIQNAQSHGIDGFALNDGGWDKSEPEYKQRTLMIYEAAARLKSGFKLFVSVDGKAANELEDIIDTVKVLPNQFKVNGRPVLSTFSGSGTDGLQGRQLLATAHRKGVFFVPYFFPRPHLTERPSSVDTEDIASKYSDLDGFFYFGAAGSGEALAASNEAHAHTWRGRGKVYMASVTPYYLGYGVNFRVFETKGFQAMAEEWESAIHGDASWVEIVTWNDWGESTYVSPIPTTGLLSQILTPHTAYLEASRYYIDWFKSGKQPSITHDHIFYFYRLHPSTLAVSTSPSGPQKMGKPAGGQLLVDHVFVTAYLKSAGRVTIVSGGRPTSFDLSAGVHQIEAPFNIGAQQFILERGGQRAINKQGERSISATDTTSRYNYFSGGAED